MTQQQDEQDVAQLLSRSGMRPEPPADVAQRVHARVLEAWNELPVDSASAASKNGSIFSLRQRPLLAMAAGCVLAVAVVFLWQQQQQSTPVPVGNVVFSSGGYSINPAGDGSSALPAGTSVRTSEKGRLLIALNSKTSVRLDYGTRVTLRANDEVFLHSGRLYVDSDGQSNDLRITTERASVTKVGTQFEVNADNAGQLEVAVREGQININMAGVQTSAMAANGAGEILRFDKQGNAARQSIATTDVARWQWTQLSRPKFDMDGKRLYDYLYWVARERGLSLRFLSPVGKQWAKQETVAGLFGASDIDLQSALATRGKLRRSRSAKDHELLLVGPDPT